VHVHGNRGHANPSNELTVGRDPEHVSNPLAQELGVLKAARKQISPDVEEACDKQTGQLIGHYLWHKKFIPHLNH
jgi:hypothetical protein